MLNSKETTLGKKNTNLKLKTYLLRIFKFLNPALIVAPLFVIWNEYYSSTLYYRPFYNKGNYAFILILFVVYAYLTHIYDGYSISTSKRNEIVLSQTISIFITDCLMYVMTYMLARHLPNPLPLLVAFAIQIVISVIWTAIASSWYFAVFPKKKTIIIYDERVGLDLLIQKYGLDNVFDITSTVHVDDTKTDLSLLESSEVVFFSGVHSHERNRILKYCLDNNIECYIIPRIGDVLMHGAKKVHMLHVPLLQVHRYNPTLEYVCIKRCMDILISLICIILFSPLMLVIAILIRIEDGGPALFKQVRLTKNGKHFTMIKFRSMCVNAEADGIARLSTGDNDNRITKIGRFIRRYRIDELPQLFNVLVGSMSIIGPRPERPEIAKQYNEIMPEFNLRLQTKAGMTGYAQIYGKYNSSPYDKLQLDLFYTINPSIIEDIRIIIATVKILFIKDSSEGIDKDKTTAAG